MRNLIEELLTQIDQQIMITDSTNKNVYEHLRMKSLESKKLRLLKIRDILLIEKYNIVFIGTIGIGKTTAICHLFNLIGEFEKEVEFNKQKKKVRVMEPLLSTGSGRTTISEVVTKADEKTHIQIDPYSKDELEKLIIEFCESFYDGSEVSESEVVSVELERAIRTITDLKKNQKVNDKNVDVAKQKSKIMSREDFIALALKNAHLDSRIFTKAESILYCPEGNDEKEWLQQSFDRINKGEEKTFSIPKRILVSVSPKILQGSQLDFFNSIIDTKGIDEIAIRSDLQNYIEQEDNVCVFTTGFNDAPETNIRELMKFSLTQRSRNYEQRFITLVLPHKGEPEKENDSDGTWEGGITTRMPIIEDVFKNQNIKILPGNIIFFDALQFYDSKGRRDRDFEIEDIQQVKNGVIEEIRIAIDRRKEILNKEIIEIGGSVQTIIDGQGISDEEMLIITETVEQLASFRDIRTKLPAFVYEEFIDQYINYYSTRYPAWNTKDAIHRRLGTFNERNYNTYFDAKVIAEGIDDEEMLKKFTKDLKSNLEKLIEDLGNSHEDLNSLTSEILKSINSYYDSFVEGVGNEIQGILELQNQNPTFWYEMIDRRGKGPGYNNEVATMLRRKLEYNNQGVSANRVLQDITERHWQILIDNLLKFFN